VPSISKSFVCVSWLSVVLDSKPLDRIVGEVL